MISKHNTSTQLMTSITLLLRINVQVVRHRFYIILSMSSFNIDELYRPPPPTPHPRSVQLVPLHKHMDVIQTPNA